LRRRRRGRKLILFPTREDAIVKRHWLWLLPVLVLCGTAVADEPGSPTAGLSDWLSIPGFTVETAVGTGVKSDGRLEGEASRFAENVGTVYCRVDAIGLDADQKVVVVWFREGDERARTNLTLTKSKPRDSVSMQIPAAQAGSWRVEVQNDTGQVLAVAPFVVGKPSLTGDAPRKTPPAH
jgi:hypothetical protein